MVQCVQSILEACNSFNLAFAAAEMSTVAWARDLDLTSKESVISPPLFNQRKDGTDKPEDLYLNSINGLSNMEMSLGQFWLLHVFTCLLSA